MKWMNQWELPAMKIVNGKGFFYICKILEADYMYVTHILVFSLPLQTTSQ